MALPCIRCGSPLAGGRFCPSCGAEQATATKEVDPCVGRTLGDRYEVGELIGVGGMGRVHRGLQRSLDRPVAIKFIHPHLMTSSAAVNRFMTEARAASRLNHPNVVSVFDFGRTAATEGGELYLVMELLSGFDLAKVMEREGPLPIPRIVGILRQTLLALSEAHRRGITHRDVKPENVFLERHYGDADHVKVIDFGIASLSDDDRITSHGQILGTPAYMAPEQVSGDPTGPSTDQYAVGVILFEMLSGRLPFEGTAQVVFYKHVTSIRPDPRDYAPHRGIPAELAQACMRAMAIDPAQRFPDAAAFSDALAAVNLSVHALLREQSIATIRAYRASEVKTYDAIAATEPSIPPPPPLEDKTISMRPPAVLANIELPLVARDESLAWCRALLERPRDLAGIALWGRPGVGKTRLVHEICARAMKHGAVIHEVRIDPPPLSEVGYSGLRKIIKVLTGLASGEKLFAAARVETGGVLEGLRAVFGPAAQRITEPAVTHQAVTSALSWAVARAAQRCGGARGLLVLDDVDTMDGSSLAALNALLQRAPAPGFLVVMTSDVRPALRPGDRLVDHEIRGLDRAAALRALGQEMSSRELVLQADDIEPLYLEQWRRFGIEAPSEPAPETLTGIIAARVQRLPPAQLRTLQTLAATGGGSLDELAPLMAIPEDLNGALMSLCEGGFAWIRGGTVAVAHALFAEVVLGMAPDGAIAEIHSRAADALADRPELIELRAHHAIRSQVGFESFMLLEEAANLRSSRGDIDGTIALLNDAVRAARIQMTRGEEDIAASAWSVFGRKLATALLDAGRLDEAHGVLIETLDAVIARDTSRALILEQLAIVARHRGHLDEAKRRWSEALSIAEQRADYSLVQRLRRPVPPLSAGETPRYTFHPRPHAR